MVSMNTNRMDTKPKLSSIINCAKAAPGKPSKFRIDSRLAMRSAWFIASRSWSYEPVKRKLTYASRATTAKVSIRIPMTIRVSRAVTNRLNDSHELPFSTLMALSAVGSKPIFLDFDVVRGIKKQISVQRYNKSLTYASN